MAVAPETAIMALYCDFENVALGVRDAKYDKFDIKPVLERLLLKGSIVVKKAYCDWERYKGFKSTMHEASFELIEIPHLRQSGKNSADIRLVVDALDLCYTKSHVDTFVIISGDSDFSPLVSKLRENAKYVIGVGVKQSTSDLLIGNCDEFIFYDDLVREMQRSARRDSKEAQPVVRRSPEEDAQRRPNSRRAAARRSNWPSPPLMRWSTSVATAARSGRRCSRKRSSGASPISANRITASGPSATCSRRRRRVACSRLAAMKNRAPTSFAATAWWLDGKQAPRCLPSRCRSCRSSPRAQWEAKKQASRRRASQGGGPAQGNRERRQAGQGAAEVRAGRGAGRSRLRK
jgi:uncharacterized LabA/DUF88 family protein